MIFKPLATTLLLTLVGGGVAHAAPAKTPALLAKGKTAYASACQPCHGPSGAGDGPAAVALNPKPRNLATEPFKQGAAPDAVFKTLTTGITGTAMAPFTHLSEDERWALVYYVLSLANGKAGDAAGDDKPTAKKKGKKQKKGKS